MGKKALILSGGGARGAFQAGVWKYLSQRRWQPDIICGASVGAVNAAGIGSGLDADTIVRLWTTHNRRRLYRLNFLSFLPRLIFGRPMVPLLDTRPVQAMLKKYTDIEAIRKNAVDIIITAVNVQTGKPVFFSNRDITLDHILASSAMPVLFGEQLLDGVPHWDGGVIANIPLQPALDAGADEIIIVNLSPVGHRPQPFPRNPIKAGEHVFEQFLAASYQATLAANHLFDPPLPGPRPRIFLLAPSRMLGFKSLINFSLKQANDLVNEGYQAACTNLKPFI